MDEEVRLYLYWVGWPVLTLGIAMFAARVTTGAAKRALVMLAVTVLMVPALFIEDAIGRHQFAAYCATDAGGKVFAQVELPAEFFSPDGTANFFDPNADIEARVRNSRFRLSRTSAVVTVGLVPVRRIDVRLVDHSTGTLLAQYVRMAGDNRLPPIFSESVYGPCPGEAEETRFFDVELKKAFRKVP